MITIEQLKEAIIALFAERPPNKELPTFKVREFVADYLNTPEADVSIEDLKSALRDTPFARPRAMLRGSSRLSWYFVAQQLEVSPVPPPAKPRKSVHNDNASHGKKKQLSESQRLKR